MTFMASKMMPHETRQVLVNWLVLKLNTIRVQILKLHPIDSELKQLLADGEFIDLWRRLVELSASVLEGKLTEVVGTYNTLFLLLETIDRDADYAYQSACYFLTEKIIRDVTNYSNLNEAGEANIPTKTHVAQVDVRLSVLANLGNFAFVTDFAELRDTVQLARLQFAEAHHRVFFCVTC